MMSMSQLVQQGLVGSAENNSCIAVSPSLKLPSQPAPKPRASSARRQASPKMATIVFGGEPTSGTSKHRSASPKTPQQRSGPDAAAAVGASPMYSYSTFSPPANLQHSAGRLGFQASSASMSGVNPYKNAAGGVRVGRRLLDLNSPNTGTAADRHRSPSGHLCLGHDYFNFSHSRYAETDRSPKNGDNSPPVLYSTSPSAVVDSYPAKIK
ncbi:unnamed protein product, partial [Amoebophrya sp. A25]|eukprot:GSA25T00011965001.1